MSGSCRPNILKRKNINIQKDATKKGAALSQNILENSQYYQKHINVCNNNVIEKSSTSIASHSINKEDTRVKRKRKISPTSQRCNIDLDDVAKIDRENRLALIEPHPDSDSIPTSSVHKPLFSEVEFLDENVWNIGSDGDDPDPPRIDETNYPRTVYDNFEWKIIKEINSEQTRRDNFTGKPGPVTDFATPYDAFTAIWNHNVLEAILKTSNKHGEAFNKVKRENNEKLDKKSDHEPPWKDITLSEMYVYLAIVMSTAACKKLLFIAYFAMSADINETPLYSKYMKQKRFRRINQAVCFIEETSLKETCLNNYEERILAIHPLVKLLNERFSSLYSLHQNIVIEKIKSVNIQSHFRKLERVVGLLDSTTGYCWQLNYIIDEVPKYKSLLQRYTESQCRNDGDIGLDDSLSDSRLPVYVKSLKKKKISEKEPSNKNETVLQENPKAPKNKLKTLNKKSDLLKSDTKKSKHDSTNKPIETDLINLDKPEITGVCNAVICNPKAPKNKPTTLNKKSDILTKAINELVNSDPKTKHESKNKPINTEPINSDTPEINAETFASLQLHQEEISIEKLQDKEILYDEDLPPLSRPVPSTILDFVKNLHFQGHTLFMDWSLQSLPLARTLKSLGIDCVGSFSGKSPYAPKDLKPYIDGKFELIPGQVLGYTTDDIDIILWNERKVLTLLSTYHGLATIGDINLQAAVDYNFSMSVVDRFKKNIKDLSFYPFGKRELQVYISYLLKISLINAFILYRSSSGSKIINLKDFVEDVVKGLLEHHSSYSPKVNIEQVVVNVSSNLRHHLPMPCKKPWPSCDFCVKSKIVVYDCVGCRKYLCVRCFTKYHETIASRMISK